MRNCHQIGHVEPVLTPFDVSEYIHPATVTFDELLLSDFNVLMSHDVILVDEIGDEEG